jgi:hypothetical protein
VERHGVEAGGGDVGMTGIVILAAVELITLHMIDGRVVQVNPRQVTHLLADTPDGHNKVLPEAVNCVVKFTDGAFLSVAESCEAVRELMEGAKP